MTKKEKEKWIQELAAHYVIIVIDEPNHDLVILHGSMADVLEDFYAQFLEDIQDERDRRNALALYFSAYHLYQYKETFYLINDSKQEGGLHEKTH